MLIEILKGTSLKKIRILLKKIKVNPKKKNIDLFFGKLPEINDGVVYQKQTRSEWNKRY